MVVYEGFENLMQHIVEVAILFFEFVGVIVIIIYRKRFQGNCNSCRNYCAPCGFDVPDSLGNQAGESQP